MRIPVWCVLLIFFSALGISLLLSYLLFPWTLIGTLICGFGWFMLGKFVGSSI